MNPAGNFTVVTAGRSATITSLMVCCGFIVCWSPNQILFFLGFVGYPINFGSWFYHSPATSLSPVLRPLVLLSIFSNNLILIRLTPSPCSKTLNKTTRKFVALPVPDTLVGWFYHFTVVLVVTNSCINPFIYAAKYREFQNGARRLVTCLARQSQQIQPQ